MNEKILRQLFCEWSEKHKWDGYDTMACDPLHMIGLAEAYNIQATPGFVPTAKIARYMMNMRKQKRLAANLCLNYGMPSGGFFETRPAH